MAALQLKYRHELDPEQKEFILLSILQNKTNKTIMAELGLTVGTLDYALIKDPDFAKEYKSVRVSAMHSKVEDLLTITDDCVTVADAQIARVKSDNIKWSAGKLIPETYGDNINLNVNHSLDLSSVLLAAENRIIPILTTGKTIETNSETINNTECIDDLI